MEKYSYIIIFFNDGEILIIDLDLELFFFFINILFNL